MPAPQLLFSEKRVREAIVRVLNRNGSTAGTAFFVARRKLLTCYHVIASQVDSKFGAEVPVVLSDGTTVTAWIDCSVSAPDLDIALLCLDDDGPVPLPCGLGGDPGQSVWTTGFQISEQHPQSAVPTNARIGGRVTVQFAGTPTYNIPGFTLENATIRPGLSGAPLVDRETGAVIGLVDAEHFRSGQVIGVNINLSGGNLDGYAVALDDVAAARPQIAALIDENRRQVAAFGRHLNALGARHLCELQTRAAVRESTGTGRFNPQTCVPRRHLSAQVESLVESTSGRLLPVVGHTGVGKTTMLSYLASHLVDSRHSTVLIRGFRVPMAASRGLEGAIAEVLTAVGEAAFPSMPALLASISPAPLVVLFDAINDVVFESRPEFDAWWCQTIDWIEKMNVRVVVTSRLQFWADIRGLVPLGLLFQQDENGTSRMASTSRGERQVVLSDFTAEEYHEARAQYRLNALEFQSDLARHPFFLAMWSELSRERLNTSLDANPTTYELLDHYAEYLSQKVSKFVRAAGQSLYTASEVSRILRELGGYLWQHQTNAIPAAVVDAHVAAKPRLLATFVEEHILEESRDMYRFAFDSIAEYLMSCHITISKLTGDELQSLVAYGRNSQASAIGLAVLRAENAGQHTDVSAALAGLCRVDTDPLLIIRCFSLLLADFRQSDRYFGALKNLIQRHGASQEWPSVVTEAVCRVLHSGRVPVSDAVSLFRPAFVHDDPYRFEWSHWQGRWSTAEFEEDCRMGGAENTPSGAVLDAFDTHPHETMSALLAWLGDETRLYNGSQSVADVASAFLYHRRLLVFEELCDALIQSTARIAETLLSVVLDAEPIRAVSVLDRWSRQDTLRDPWVVSCGFQLVQRNSREVDEAGLGDVLDRLWGRVGSGDASDDIVYATLVAALSACPSRRDRMFSLIRDALVGRQNGFKPSMLLPYIPERWSDVIDVLDALVTSGNTATYSDIATVLGSEKIGPDQRLDAIGRLADLLGKADECDREIAFEVEKLLHRMPSDDEYSRTLIVQLAMRCLRELPPAARKCIIYYSTDYNIRGTDRIHADELLTESLANEANDECQNLLIRKLSGHHSSFRSLLNALRPLAERMDRDQFEERTLTSLFIPSLAVPAEYFNSWRDAIDSAQLGPSFRSIYTCISTDRSPHEVVDCVLRKRRSEND